MLNSTKFDELRPEIEAMLAAAKFTRHDEAVGVAKRLLQSKPVFEHLTAISGVPALWVMPVFEREEPSFHTYLGNGDPLNKPTTHVPKNRGPFDTWEDGAKDAFVLDHVTLVHDWSPAMMCFMWESWNGFGPRIYHGRPSGYVWSGTDEYAGGKYTGDGKWSRGTWDVQLGCVAVARAIVELDPTMGAI